MNLVCGLIITLMACQMGAAGNKISALKKRLHILEARVSLGENEFREGIEKLLQDQNQTCGCSDEKSDTVDQSMTLVPQNNAEYKNMLQAFERFKHGVYSEKKFLRKTISDLLNKVDEHINSCQKINSDTLRIANSKLDALEQRVIDKQSGFNDKLVNLESQNEALEQRLIDKQSNFENKIVNLESQNKALEQRLIDKQSSFENEIVNLEFQNKALDQRVIDKQSNFENKIVNLESQNKALEQRLIDKQSSFENKIANLESQNKALEQRLIDKQSNFENKIVNLESQNKALEQRLINLVKKLANQVNGLGPLLCQPDERYHDGSCYKYVDEYVSWTEAVEKCTGMNSYLVEINDIPEFDFIRSLMMKENYYSLVWVGASYQETESAFVWHNSGQPVGDFLPWQHGPSPDLGYRCVYMDIVRKLVNTKCAVNSFLEYLCERTP